MNLPGSQRLDRVAFILARLVCMVRTMGSICDGGRFMTVFSPTSEPTLTSSAMRRVVPGGAGVIRLGAQKRAACREGAYEGSHVLSSYPCWLPCSRLALLQVL